MIVAVPFGYLYYLTLRGESGQPGGVVGKSAVRGLVYGLILSFVLLLVRRFVDHADSGAGLFWFLAMHDLWLPSFILFGFYLLSTPDVRGTPDSERRLGLVSFFAGGLGLISVLDLFARANYHGVYELFQLPSLRIALMIAFPMLYYLYSEETFWIRYLYLSALIILPLLLAFVGLLTWAGYALFGSLVAVVLVAASFAGAVFVGATGRSSVFF
jgi:hypothetical protein